MNASEIAEKIKISFGLAAGESKVDGLQIGKLDTAITGVAVAWTPTLEILERAVSENRNFILTKENPFWQDAAPRPEQVVSGASPVALIEKTDLYRYKHDYIFNSAISTYVFSIAAVLSCDHLLRAVCISQAANRAKKKKE